MSETITGHPLPSCETQRGRSEEIERLFTLSLDLLCVAGFDGYFKRLNPAWEKTLGYSLEELMARPYAEFLHPDDRRATLREVVKLTGGAITYSFENRYRTKDGSYRWLSWNSIPVPSEQRIYAAARDITDQKRNAERIATLNAALERRVAELNAANRDLEAFAYSVSHDLRAPLRHIDGFARILEEESGAQLDPPARRCLERIRQGAQRMGTLMDDLLNLSRVGRQAVQWQRVELVPLVEQICRDLRELAEQRGVKRRIEWRIGALPVVEADPNLLRQVYTNLLSNAAKYTRPREPAVVEIGAIQENGETVLFVRDNGVGFSMKYADKLFGVFQRLHRQEEFEGTGVGLALAHRVIQKHGGRIWAEAEPGHGACFYFTLGPVEASAQAEPPTPPATAESAGGRAEIRLIPGEWD